MLGDLVLDIVATGSDAVERGTDVPATIRFRVGGSAANTARSFARLGGRAAFIGAIGNDGWGRRMVAALRAAGVEVHVVRVAHPTARLVCIVDGHGERSFLTERGAADHLIAADIQPAWLASAGALHIPGYSLFNRPIVEAALAAASMAHERGALVSVDLSSIRPMLTVGRDAAMTAIKAVGPAILFATNAEAEALAVPLLDLAPMVVVKSGSHGCQVLRRGSPPVSVATKPLAPADTTGAGDAFTAGFLWLLLDESAPATDPWPTPLLRRAAGSGHAAASIHLTSPRDEMTT